MIVVAHVAAIHPISLEVETLALTSGRHFTAGGLNYIPAIKSAPSYQQSLFSRGTTSGEVSVGIGELVLQNIDKRFDYLRTYGFDGQEIELYILDDENDVISEDKLYFRGTVFYCAITVEDMTLNLMSRLQELDIPCIEATFLGDNAGPVGLEGTDETIKGKQKPMVYGRCFNIPLYCLNTSTLIYGCNFHRDGTRKPVKYFKCIRDKGGEILFEANVADAAALAAASVSAGYYQSCFSEGLIKLGSVPQGDVTADVCESDGEDSSAAKVARRMLEELKGYTTEDFNVAELNTLDAKNLCPVGIYITDDMSILSAVTQVLDAISGWMIPDSTGYFRFGRVEDPVNYAPVATITDDMYLENSLNRIPTNDDARNIPAFKLELKHTRNWEPMTKNEMLPSLDEETKGSLQLEYRSVTSEDGAVKVAHPNATYLTYETLLMKSQQAKFRTGTCDIDLYSDWILNQISGFGGGQILDGQMTLNPGTGEYRAEQILTDPDEIYAGNYFLKFDLVSGTVAVQIRDAAGVIVSQTFNTAGTKTLSFTYTGTNPNITVRLTVTNATGSAVMDNFFVYEVNPGLSVQEEADRRFAIQKKTQERFTLRLDFQTFRFIEVGNAIILKDPRFELSAGKNFLVIGRDDDLPDEEIELDIWSINEY